MDQHQQEPERSTPASEALEQPAVPPLSLSIATLLAVFAGGAIGTVCRYLLDTHHPIAQGHFPWPTLLINLSGSLAIGILVSLTDHFTPRTPLARPFLVVGLLGGWTTYSTLAVESTLLGKDGDIGTLLAYIAATVIGGLTLVVAGSALGQRLVPQ